MDNNTQKAFLEQILNSNANAKNNTKSNKAKANTYGINTPLGTVIVIADIKHAYFLAFKDQENIENKIKMLIKKTNFTITVEKNSIISLIEEELNQYFKGKLTKFTTPIYMIGSNFQKQVWAALLKTSYGQTQSYLEIANSLNLPQHSRAVAKANASNLLSIIIPCHRIINNNNKLGGYSGGIERKKYLIETEKEIVAKNYL
ncbi:methylated-DNA--[protein]-cysteine S-methyltransferase [Candidatus Babela massiliensis]|uniref:methylated-DNA--[protein]-cysteine S-methyltransferase n=1 Tax=Candidatus Babela massiliensis TaxID=673862 RepID=V6DJ69_9BACT|nr:methylated-DNA--[protein]-cysteine S-methyltransferase [Candidatus Babela massiliensis]CDK30556.1 Methylated-DNA-protein-cysteine methyltransferase [Candidatus Babela massiliensis]